MHARTLIATVLFALAPLSGAIAQTATPVPDVKPDFSSMQFLLGTWTCKTVKATSGRGSGRTETDVTAMSLDGHWMTTNSTSNPFDAARTRAFVTQSWTGYDATTKQWVVLNVDNFGGYGMSTSPGWTGNTMVWNDKVSAQGGPLGVDTLTKVSNTSTHDVYTVTTPKGTETTEADCTKS